MVHKRHGRGIPRKKRTKSSAKLTDGQKRFLKETGELHPSELKDGVRKYTRVKDEEWKKPKKPVVESSSSESEEDESAFQQLMTSIGQRTEDYESSDDEDEEEDDDDVDDDAESVEDEHGDLSRDSEDSEVSEGEVEVNLKSKNIKEVVSERGKKRTLTDSGDEGDDEKLCERKKSKKKVSDDVGGKNLKKKKLRYESDSVDEDADELDLVEDEDDANRDSDPFSIHFEKDLEDDMAEKCLEQTWEKKEIKIPQVAKAFIQSRNWDLLPKTEKFQSLQHAKVKQSLCGQVAETNRTMCNPDGLKATDILTPLQQGLFCHANAYQDVYYAERTHVNGEEVRLVYCLHALNHVLKTRTRVISHNTKIKSKKDKSDADEYRDQGLTRPKVLMILPFRESAIRVVNLMSSLLGSAEQVMVSSKKRFKSEFGGEDDQNYRKGLKPEDFESTFSGNNDDHFRLGIAVSKKSLKLYVPFYQADIILTSPLGLRTVIGAEGEKDRDFDFLSSIELLILDQADIFLMQNWDHVLHMFKHLHLQPKESHGCDFSRVRMWTLNGWSHLYRQTVIFSGVSVPEINAIFNKHCHNYAGKVQIVRNPGNGIICQIITQTPQTFQRLSCTSFTQLADARFEFFIKKLVPHHKDPVMIQTLVYIPSYFDFVRIRNYFKKEDIDFVHMNEYASDKGISRVRCDFFHGKAQFLLYTERLHFYRRFRVRGIKHIIFYELPTYPHFYSEMCNMIKDPKRGVENAAATCTVIYSKYDAQKLAEVVGSKRASVMLNSDKSVHMFVTGQDS